MDKDVLKTIWKCVIFGVIWAIILVGIAFIITNFKDYKLKDILFVEGIIFVIGGILSAIGGNPIGLSLQGLGQSNAQYVANANLEVTKMEKNKTNNFKTTVSVGVSTVSKNHQGWVKSVNQVDESAHVVAMWDCKRRAQQRNNGSASTSIWEKAGPQALLICHSQFFSCNPHCFCLVMYLLILETECEKEREKKKVGERETLIGCLLHSPY